MRYSALAAAACCLFACTGCTSTNGNNTASDYAKIEQVRAACESIAGKKVVNQLGDRGTWHVFQLEFIHLNEDGVYQELEYLLGEDFDTTLSNGDDLFVGFLPIYGSYRVYAGPYEDDMLYPDWNYMELPAPTT